MNKYEYVGESTTKTVGDGKVGDNIVRIVVVPTSELATGTLTIKDGSGSSMTLYGADSTVLPVSLELGIQSVNEGGWSVTTGTGITAIIVIEG